MNREALAVLFTLALAISLLACSALAFLAPSTRGWSIPTSLGLVTFVAVLNGQLHGGSKDKIDAVVGILALGLFGLTVFVHGWATAGGYLLACLLFGAFSLLIAAPLARYMTGRS